MFGGLAIEELRWQDVRTAVYDANSELAAMIDHFDPSDDFTFIKASYPYGAKILNDGVIFLPKSDGSTIALNHDSVSSTIRKKLSYSPVPMGLVLTKSMEVYFETADRVMPSKLYGKGVFFGLWEVFDCRNQNYKFQKVWNLSAGARTLFMLPRITDHINHGRLRRDFGISEYPPKELLDHNKVFRELAVNTDRNSPNKWMCEVLFFNDKWSLLDEDKGNINSLNLSNYLYRCAWGQSKNCRNQMDYNVSWEAFANEASRKNLKVKPYMYNTIKHLIAISEGMFPGFISAKNDFAAPIKLIQDCYINSYLLKDYAPIIMHPAHINNIDNQYVYYSLHLPTLLEWAPRLKGNSIITDIRELRMLTNLYIQATENKHLVYEFFHSEDDPLAEIKSSKQLPIDDPALLASISFPINQEFPINSPFFRGCVRVKKCV